MQREPNTPAEAPGFMLRKQDLVPQPQKVGEPAQRPAS